MARVAKIMRTSSSHEEGCERIWGLNATSFNADEQGNLVSVSFDEVRGEELPVDGNLFQPVPSAPLNVIWLYWLLVSCIQSTKVS